MDVSIVMPLHKPDRDLLKKIQDSLKRQVFKGKKEIIIVEKGLGLADSLNYGIVKAKHSIIVSLHQDCVPSDTRWLEKLIAPLKEQNVVATVSKVELPHSLWSTFDRTAKILSSKERKVITPLLDEKGCAYKKSALIQTGLFDGKTFRTAGEDFDIYLKLKKIGSIAYPDAKVIHYHHYTGNKRLKKEYQLANGFGALVRLYGSEMPAWYIGLVKAIPFIGYPLFFKGLSVKTLGRLVFLAIPLLVVVNLIYSYGFWKGFFEKKQTI